MVVLQAFAACGYLCRVVHLSPLQYGVPNSRGRAFVLAFDGRARRFYNTDDAGLFARLDAVANTVAMLMVIPSSSPESCAMIPLDEFVKFPQPECMQRQRRASAKRESVVSGTEMWIQRHRTWYAKHNVPFLAPVPGKHVADENGFGRRMSCLRNFFAATQQAILQDAEAKSRILVAESKHNIERTQGYLPVTSCIYPNSCQCTQHGDALPEYTNNWCYMAVPQSGFHSSTSLQ